MTATITKHRPSNVKTRPVNVMPAVNDSRPPHPSFDFATTRNFYGARRAVQAAAAEVHQKLVVSEKADELVRDVEQAGQLTPEELKALKRLLNSIRQPEADSQNG